MDTELDTPGILFHDDQYEEIDYSKFVVKDNPILQGEEEKEDEEEEEEEEEEEDRSDAEDEEQVSKFLDLFLYVYSCFSARRQKCRYFF